MTILSIDGLSKRFGGLPAVSDVTFSVRENEFCGIIGPNGAGKTTLMNLITGYHQPDAGEIKFRGKSINGSAPYNIAHRGVARSFQVVRPFLEMSVYDNVLTGALFARREVRRSVAAEDRTVSALKLVDLTGKSRFLASQLTLGEKKRLELARCLAANPSLLLLDEVFGGLSEGESASLVNALKRIHDTGATILMVEHVLRALVRLVDRIIVLNFGRVLCDGSVAEVMSNQNVIESYLGKQTTSSL